jgi:hypothetical protein
MDVCILLSLGKLHETLLWFENMSSVTGFAIVVSMLSKDQKRGLKNALQSVVHRYVENNVLTDNLQTRLNNIYTLYNI